MTLKITVALESAGEKKTRSLLQVTFVFDEGNFFK